jgi:hypothetical protein
MAPRISSRSRHPEGPGADRMDDPAHQHGQQKTTPLSSSPGTVPSPPRSGHHRPGREMARPFGFCRHPPKRQLSPGQGRVALPRRLSCRAGLDLREDRHRRQKASRCARTTPRDGRTGLRRRASVLPRAGPTISRPSQITKRNPALTHFRCEPYQPPKPRAASQISSPAWSRERC